MKKQLEKVERQVRITVLKHRDTDLLMATSYDLLGLMVPGRSEEELAEKIPAAIREILEAEGNEVLSVEFMEPRADLPEEFIPPPHIADAVVRLAH